MEVLVTKISNWSVLQLGNWNEVSEMQKSAWFICGFYSLPHTVAPSHDECKIVEVEL